MPVYLYIFFGVYVCVYIYIYIYRERERGKNMSYFLYLVYFFFFWGGWGCMYMSNSDCVFRFLPLIFINVRTLSVGKHRHHVPTSQCIWHKNNDNRRTPGKTWDCHWHVCCCLDLSRISGTVHWPATAFKENWVLLLTSDCCRKMGECRWKKKVKQGLRMLKRWRDKEEEGMKWMKAKELHCHLCRNDGLDRGWRRYKRQVFCNVKHFWVRRFEGRTGWGWYDTPGTKKKLCVTHNLALACFPSL